MENSRELVVSRQPLSLTGKTYFSEWPSIRYFHELLLRAGFLIASIVPTARFAQPIGAAILYPMIGLCGLFVPVQSLPPAMQAVARVLPLTYAVSLLQGIWKGEAWSAHLGDVAALVVVFVICTALSAKVFRWE